VAEANPSSPQAVALRQRLIDMLSLLPEIPF